MILVSKPEKPFDYTAKFTVRRQAMITLYEPEIEALYKNVDETSLTGLHPPSKWDSSTTLEFVRRVVTTVVRGDLTNEEDLFQRGCDRLVTNTSHLAPRRFYVLEISLQATWIRNSILHALRNSPTDVNVRQIPANFVYHHPSIARLAAYISSVANNESNGQVKTEDTVRAMLELVDKYSQNFPVHQPSSSATTEPNGLDVVLVTGTTGGLGASLLATLIQSERVGKIYALNRKSRSGKVLKERQKDVLVERGLDTALLDFPKVVFLEADLEEPLLGLPQELYNEVRSLCSMPVCVCLLTTVTQILSSITHIIHNGTPSFVETHSDDLI